MKYKKNLIVLIFILCMGSVGAQSKEELKAQVLENKDDVSSLRLIEKIGGNTPDYNELNALFEKTSRKVKRSREGKFFKQYLKALENTSPDKKALGLTQFDLEGMPVSLMDFQGRVVLLHFWASWCHSCLDELSAYKEVYNTYKSEDLEILAVSFDQDIEEWKRAVEKNDLPWVHISDLMGMNNAARHVYGIRALPQNILVGADGKIIERNIDLSDLNQRVDAALKSPH